MTVSGELGSWDLQGKGSKSIEVPLDGVDVPPPLGARGSEIAGLGPAVFHLVTPPERAPLRASSVISRGLGLPEDFARQLLEFGAVHPAGSPPLPRRGAEHIPMHVIEARERARATAGHAAAFGVLQKVRRLRADEEMAPGSYLRVHARPKRFPACYDVDWTARVVALSPDWVVLDKPPGVPVCPTVDNWLENCLVCGSEAVGDAEPLLMTHRLDVVTSGVFVMGRSSAFVSHFNNLLQADRGGFREPGSAGPRISKEYRALCAHPPPLGRLVHNVSTNTEHKGSATYTAIVSPSAPGALKCELDIISVAKVPLGPKPMAGEDWENWGSSGFEVRIRLLTGRTHQIRAQLAAEGCPILGDGLYAAVARAGSAPPTGPLRAPRFRIALQSAQLTIRDAGSPFFNGPEATFESGAPWWREEVIT